MSCRWKPEGRVEQGPRKMKTRLRPLRTPLLGRTRTIRLAGVRRTNEQPRCPGQQQSKRQRDRRPGFQTLVGFTVSQPFQIIQFQGRSRRFHRDRIRSSLFANGGDPNTRTQALARVQSIEARAVPRVGDRLQISSGPDRRRHACVAVMFHRAKKESVSIPASLLRLSQDAGSASHRGCPFGRRRIASRSRR
jgi:hypothetical protein